MKKTKLIHRIGSALLAAAVCVTTLFANGNVQRAEAATNAGDKDTSQVQSIQCNSDGDFVDNSATHSSIAWHYRTNSVSKYGNVYADFCLERGKEAVLAGNYTAVEGYRNDIGLTKAAYYYIALAEYYGYPNKAKYQSLIDLQNMYKDTDLYVATQVVIWEILGGYRNLSYNSDAPNNTDTSSFATLKSTSPYDAIINKMYASNKTNKCRVIYNQIVSDIAKHTQRMSFAGKEADPAKYTMKYDNAKKLWTLTLNDTNDQIKNFANFKTQLEAQGYSVTVNGNAVTITAPESKQGASDVIKFKKDWAFTSVRTPIVWYSEIYQDTLPTPAAGQADPVSAAIQLETPTVMGKVRVLKVDPYNNPLAGAKFKISYAEDYVDPQQVTHLKGEEVCTIKSGEDGYAETSITIPLYLDAKYSIAEFEAPAGYVLVSAPTEFTFDSETDYYVPNHDFLVKEFRPVNTETETHVHKRAATGDNELVGAHLQLWQGDTLIEEWDSTADDHVVKKLKYNTTYTLKETIAPKGYKLASAKDFKINDDGSVTHVEMIDEYQTGTIEVQKRTFGMTDLEGISLILKGTPTAKEYGEVNQEQVTDANGKATFSYVPVGTYTIYEKESSVPVGYYVAEPTQVTVYNAQTTTATIYNKSYGSVSIQKRTEGMTDLSGIKFNLSGTSSEGDTVNLSAVTDDNGVADFDEVPIGTYTISEDGETVPYGYLIAQDQQAEVIKAQTTEVEVKNESCGDLQIQKRTEGMTDISGIKFNLSGTSSYLGTEVNMSAVTDNEGKAVFEKVPVGVYTITEDGETVPYGYFVADPFEAKIVKAQTTEVEVKNESYGELTIKKRTPRGTDLGGIKFNLSGTSNEGKTVNMSAVTDENGKAVFGKVPVGTYTITEDGSTVPYGYLVADAKKGTVIKAQTTEVEFINYEAEEDHPPKTGETGENTNSPAVFGGCAAFSLCMIVIAVLKKKKRI